MARSLLQALVPVKTLCRHLNDQQIFLSKTFSFFKHMFWFLIFTVKTTYVVPYLICKLVVITQIYTKVKNVSL